MPLQTHEGTFNTSLIIASSTRSGTPSWTEEANVARGNATRLVVTLFISLEVTPR